MSERPRLVLAILTAGLLSGCRSAEPADNPPPDARRPVLKSESELTAEHEAGVSSGAIVATTSPRLGPAPASRPASAFVAPLQPQPGAIQADLLMVNDAILTVDEVLFPLWDELTDLRKTQTLNGFRAQARQRIEQEIRRSIGGVLVYAQAMSKIEEDRRGAIDEYVKKEIDDIRNRTYGGSEARLKAQLAARGLTMDQLKERIKREMIVRQYTREQLWPQVQVRRDELLGYYRQHEAEFGRPGTRELRMIELPFERFLPAGQSWGRAAESLRAQARLEAARRARAAHAALAERSFDDVAREFSLGLHAAEGGSYGQIGRALQPPFDKVSALIFDYSEGQTSAPIEMPTGWVIVQCGTIVPAVEKSFVAVQDEIRQKLMEQRFQKLSVDYVLRLAETATISALESFVATAVRRAEEGTAAAVAGT